MEQACCMMSSNVRKQYGYSEVKTSYFEYEWVIKDFSRLCQRNEEYILSPKFSAMENDEVKWRLLFYPQGRNKGDDTHVGVFLHLYSQDAAKTKIQVHCELSISKSESFKWKKSFMYTYENLNGCGFDDLERSALLNSGDSDDLITIRCKVTIPQRTITKPVTKQPEYRSVDPVSFDLQKDQLYEHFAQLLGDSRFCDLTIIVGEVKFAVHKVVLAMRSKVLAAMFEHKDMEENRKNEWKIEDLEPATVKGMLEFIYTDKVTDLETLATELLKASDKYELNRLRVMCEESIYKTLTCDNAAEILVVSDLYHSHKLKEYVMAFIDDNLLAVIQSESYNSMAQEHPALLKDLIHRMALQRELKA